MSVTVEPSAAVRLNGGSFTATASHGRTYDALVNRFRVAALALAVALVLGDGSVVVLALPAVYREYSAQVSDVTWVITAFNLAVALAAIPAARFARRRGAPLVCAGGLAIFAASSAACALAPSLAVLISARAVQGIGGAAAVTAALELLPDLMGGERAATRLWAIAGGAGAALGPAVGGVLTELISWQSIFIAQIPLALLPIPLIAGLRGRRQTSDPGRPHIAANAALLLLSAGLAAALFLIVLLLIEGWQLSPITAALVVSALPAATIAAAPLERRLGPARVRAIAGAVLAGGGLAGLGLLPGPRSFWTWPPQILIGIGLALALGALTETALSGRSAVAIHGGTTIAARHAGVVLGLVLLTPVLVGDLDRQRARAERAAAAAFLDARVSLTTQATVATAVSHELAASPGQLPNVKAIFARVEVEPKDRAEIAQLQRVFQDQLDRAATSSFSRSFLFAAVLALLALIPIVRGRELDL